MKIALQILIPRADAAGSPQEPNRALQRAIEFEDRPPPGTEITLEDGLSVMIQRYQQSGLRSPSRRKPVIALVTSSHSIEQLTSAAPQEWEPVVLPKRAPVAERSD